MRFFAFYFTNDVHGARSRFVPLNLRSPVNLLIKPGRHCMITTNLITLDTTKLEQSFVCSHGLFLAVLRTFELMSLPLHVWLSSAMLVHLAHFNDWSAFVYWEDVFFSVVMGLLVLILLLLK